MENTSLKWNLFINTFSLLMVAWYAFTVSLAMTEIITLLIIMGIIATLNFTSFTHYGFLLFHPRKIAFLLQYSFVFIVTLIKANFQVPTIVLNPKLPVNPDIVKFKKNLKSYFYKMILTNS